MCACVPVCLCAGHSVQVPREARGGVRTLEVERHVVVSHVGAGNQTQALQKISKCS